ncbi:GNAT family N-acetyltransferase [Enterovibrio nigricans]|uniref:GNAT family N-acetyltransferase n=1 Tax=Enterovibrio nigricans TaxID=504469 RepID=UPI000999A9B5|nr:GNAT family N-acetyltransferase [Enterovibrio nigricans]PKF48939.1 N-acetyltransferase [Enterovibrio nigricans]
MSREAGSYQVVVSYFFLWWYSSEFPVLGIGISQKYQGQGLGGKLIEILIENARSNNCRAIELTTVLNNNRAFALYQKLGFLYLGKVNNLVGDGSVVEESHMYFPIEPGVKIPQRNHVTPFL